VLDTIDEQLRQDKDMVVIAEKVEKESRASTLPSRCRTAIQSGHKRI
jgi:hypothetical protein